MIGGWFPDPDGAPGRLRWWDGARWTEHTTSASSPDALVPPGQAPAPSWWRRLLARSDSARPGEPTRGAGTYAPRADDGLDRWTHGRADDGLDRWTHGRADDGLDRWTHGRADDGPHPPPHSGPRRDNAHGQHASAPYGQPPRADGPYARPPDQDVIEGRAPSPRASRAGAVAGSAVVIAVLIAAVVLGVIHFTGKNSASEPLPPTASTSSAPAPPLQRLCKDTGPTIRQPRSAPAPAPTGPRIGDHDAGISYLELPAPFHRWDRGLWGAGAGSLGEQFGTGQYFITQEATPDGQYMATVLSGTVPAAYGDDPRPNIECAGRVVAEDVRGLYYPQPNTRTDIESRPMVIDGHPAYYTEFHLSFDRPGFNAKGELVAICVIDVDGPNAAIVYISIPDTHRQYDVVVGKIIDSLRVGR